MKGGAVSRQPGPQRGPGWRETALADFCAEIPNFAGPAWGGRGRGARGRGAGRQDHAAAKTEGRVEEARAQMGVMVGRGEGSNRKRRATRRYPDAPPGTPGTPQRTVPRRAEKR